MAKSAKRKPVKSVKRGTRMKRGEDAAFELKLVSNPLERGTFGAVGAFFEVRAAREFTNELLNIPYQREAARLVDENTLRLFWWDVKARSFVLVEPSGVDVERRVVWGRIAEPGIYGAIGLPRDKELRRTIEVFSLFSAEELRAAPQLIPPICGLVLCGPPINSSGPGGTLCDLCLGIDVPELHLPELQLLDLVPTRRFTVAPKSPPPVWPAMFHDSRNTSQSTRNGPSRTAAIAWTFSAATPNTGVSQPVVGSDGTVYVAAFALFPNIGPSTLYALNGSSGQIRWRLNLPLRAGRLVFQQPAMGHDGTIFVNAGRDLIAVRPSGLVKWTYQGPQSDELYYPLASPDGSVYVRAYFAGIIKLDANGALAWPAGFPLGSASPLGAPFAVRVDGTLIIVGDDAWAVDANRQNLWTFSASSVDAYDYRPPIVGDDHRVIIPSGNAVHVLSSGGTLQWVRSRGFAHDSWVAVASNGVLYMGGGGHVIGLNANGSPRWTHSVGGIPAPSIGPAAIGANGTLYAVVRRSPQVDELRALDPATGARLWGSPIQMTPRNPQYYAPLPAPVIGLNGMLLVADFFAGTVTAFG